MAAKATFRRLETYELSEVNVTDRELGHGSYASVIELEYMGLKCAGKKIHELLLKQGNDSYTVRRFEEECRLLSQVRHPNIVQFLGVHFQRGVQVPILVMEFLPTNLTSCIEQHGILPNEISYSILHDVALGLCYLHSQTPPIIHRDLSSNNVLLTANMTAKISDLGVARILNLTPLQVSRMTQTPGTPAYMPPEVMVANPKYDTSVDEFSYGILMIHMFSGRWPEPQVGPSRFEDGKLIPITEAERRDVFLQAIGFDHPLMDLILICVHNDPGHRPCANEAVGRLAVMKSQFPPAFVNPLEMLKYSKHLDEEQKELRSLQRRVHEKSEEAARLDLIHSSEVEQLKLQLEAEMSQSKMDRKSFELKISTLADEISRSDSALKARDSELQAKGIALDEKDTVIKGMNAQLTKLREHLVHKQQVQCIVNIILLCVQILTCGGSIVANLRCTGCPFPLISMASVPQIDGVSAWSVSH